MLYPGDKVEAAAYPGVAHWWVGGHSPGGVVATSYAEKYVGPVEGVALLAAYGDDGLVASGLKSEVVYGTNDGVVNRDSLAKCVASLPDGSTCVIKGGNHAGFGDYGAQDGDGEASISASDQQDIAAKAVVAAIKGEA